MGKHKNRRRARIERPATGTSPCRRTTRSGRFGGHLGTLSHSARRPRGGRGGLGSDATRIDVIEPWGYLSTRHS